MTTHREPAGTEIPWQPAQIRFSIFHAEGNRISGDQWWELATGNVPDKKNTQPKTSELLVEGAFGSGKLQLSVNPLRVDWKYTVSEDITAGLELTTLGPLDRNLEQFNRLLAQWFVQDPIPSATRLAFGVVLLSRVDSLEQGYELLRKYLHSIEVDTVGSSDLLFQVNRPRDSIVLQGLKLNRLTKWAVLRLQSNLIADTAVGMVTQNEALASTLELDINTDKDYREQLPADLFPKLYEELTQLGVEIAEKGDIK